MLAVQMVGVHELALKFLRRTSGTDNIDISSSCGLQATRLMRLFVEQTEAMAKLKGKTGQQKAADFSAALLPAIRLLGGEGSGQANYRSTKSAGASCGNCRGNPTSLPAFR